MPLTRDYENQDYASLYCLKNYGTEWLYSLYMGEFREIKFSDGSYLQIDISDIANQIDTLLVQVTCPSGVLTKYLVPFPDTGRDY